MTTDRLPPVEPLDVDNFYAWQSKMKYLLIAKGLWKVVTGETSAQGKDEQALAEIGLHVKNHNLPLIEQCGSAQEAWERLESTFRAKSNARKRQLRKALSDLRMGATEPLSKFAARAKELQNQASAIGYEIPDQEITWALMAGLPDKYENVITMIEAGADQDASIDDVLPQLMTVELRHPAHDESRMHEKALAAKRGYGTRPSYNPERNNSRRCWVCGETDHIARDCPRKHGNRQQSACVAL